MHNAGAAGRVFGGGFNFAFEPAPANPHTSVTGLLKLIVARGLQAGCICTLLLFKEYATRCTFGTLVTARMSVATVASLSTCSCCSVPDRPTRTCTWRCVFTSTVSSTIARK